MLNGWKTKVGATIAALPVLWTAIEGKDWTLAISTVGGLLAIWGAAHKIEKLTAAVTATTKEAE